MEKFSGGLCPSMDVNVYTIMMVLMILKGKNSRKFNAISREIIITHHFYVQH